MSGERTIGVSIYFKIFCAWVVVIAFFSVIIVTYNIININNMKSSIINSEHSKLEYFCGQFEKEISRILEIQKAYLNDADLQMLSIAAETMSNYRRQKSMKNVLEKFSVLQSSSEFVEDVTIHIPLINKSISTSKGISPLKTDEFDSLKKYNSFKSSPIIKWNGKYYLSIVFPAAYGEISKPIGYNISIRLSREAVEGYLRSISMNSGGGILLYNKPNNWSIIFDSNYNNQETSRFILKICMKEIEVESISFANENYLKDYLILQAHSDYLNVDFIYFIPHESLFHSVSK